MIKGAMRSALAGLTIEFFLSLRRRFALLPRIKCCLPEVERRILPEPVTLKRLAAARLVFILGMTKPLPTKEGLSIRSSRPGQVHSGPIKLGLDSADPDALSALEIVVHDAQL